MAALTASQPAIVVRLVRASGYAIDAFQPLDGEPLPDTATVRDVQLRLKIDREYFIGKVPVSGLSVYGPFAREPLDDQIKDLIREKPLKYDVVLSTHKNYVAARTNYFLVCVALPALAPAAGASPCHAVCTYATVMRGRTVTWIGSVCRQAACLRIPLS